VVTSSPPARLEEGAQGFHLVAGGDRIEAPAIVAADGLGSGLRRAAGLNGSPPGARFGVSGHVELAVEPPPAVEVFFQSGFEIYITPVGGRVANVAVLLSRPMSRLLRGSPASLFEDLLRRESCLGDGWRLLDQPLVSGPFPVRPGRLWSRNLVLAGDAAGFFDGITGEGMSLALASARDCAAAVDAYLDNGNPEAFREYGRRRRRLRRNSELLGRFTLLMASREWTARRAILGLARRPAVFSRLVALSSGEAGLRQLRPFDLLAPLLG
jgi:2-polyprenyl-6-methoxyphenol hydroxylase-like FAD-dependent oxidoreductase